jgi:predicted glycoside hydrolase/deacetylase ChbG (UPF0249 family)
LKFQLDKFLKAGFRVTHFDSHQNIHLIPLIYKQFNRLKKDYNLNIPVRIPKEKINNPLKIKSSNLKRMLILNSLSRISFRAHDKKHNIKTIGGDFYNNPQPSGVFDRIMHELKGAGDQVYELAVHPGYYSDEILIYDTYAHERETELQFLKSYSKEAFAERIRITSFGKLN